MAYEKLKIQELLRAYESNSLTPDEVREEYFRQAADLDKKYNLFITLLEEKKSSRNFIPAAAADNLCLEGGRTTGASRIMENYQSPFSAFALEKAAAVGFAVLGKTNLDEFGIGDSAGISCYKTTLNPRAAGFRAGSGAAAAVAAGAVKAAFASDATGGLRQQASCAGVVGIKPTYGRVSRRGLVEFAPSLDQIGVIAGNVEDAAFSLAAISGYDIKDPTSSEEPVDFYPLTTQDGVEALKLACPGEWQEAGGADPVVAAFFTELLAFFDRQGIKVETVSMPALKGAALAATLIGSVEAFSTLSNYDGVRFGSRTPGKHLHDMYIQTRTAGFGSRVKEYLTLGALVSSEDKYEDYFLWAQRYRRWLKNQFLAVLKDNPIIVLPTLPFAPPPLDWEDTGLVAAAAAYTAPANLVGLPALSLPAGLSDEGLPLGIQLIGAPFREGELLRAAARLEAILPSPGLHRSSEEA
ncbi:MAG TPA: Asp-tRNA(Asn)/Glu-tRNA(Gln) amidotransferase subunit GatA [Firmicutes bacterium]|nr:Asp-tRNA(Asn)/Glu-tRNA(Gln) amidotransferase subunit GatA [Bacillota bacterium]